MIDVTYLDIGHTTLMCRSGHYGLDGQTITPVVIHDWVVKGSYFACRLEGFHMCARGVRIKIWVTAVGHMEPFRAQLGKTLNALL